MKPSEPVPDPYSTPTKPAKRIAGMAGTIRIESISLMILGSFFCISCREVPNGLRYPLVGGTRQRHFAGTSSKPHKLPENAQTPTSRVHAVLGCLLTR